VSGTKLGVKHVLVEADEIGLADSNGRGAQVTGWAEHCLNSLGADIRFDVKFIDFFAFHGDKATGGFEHCGGVISLQLSTGGHCFVDLDIAGFQELGCFGAGGSSLAEVVPVGFVAHDFSLNG
jgi:hypothetical protein